MSAIEYAEIEPSLVSFLDIDILRSCSGCLCNTRVVSGITHGVDRNGPFLVLETYDASMTCLCVPLYGNGGPNRIELDQAAKTGPGQGWRSGLSHFSVLEFWEIPFSCFVDASHIEYSSKGNRQRYGQARPGALADIIAHRDDGGTPLVPVSN